MIYTRVFFHTYLDIGQLVSWSMVSDGLVKFCWGSNSSFALCLSLILSVDRSKSESFQRYAIFYSKSALPTAVKFSRRSIAGVVSKLSRGTVPLVLSSTLPVSFDPLAWDTLGKRWELSVWLTSFSKLMTSGVSSGLEIGQLKK